MSTIERQRDLILLELVTPERTLLDEPVLALRFPLFDGQIGILPGRAPLVGRLGYGVLKITTTTRDRAYYVDGGFVQIKGPNVCILTNRALTPEQIDPQAAEEELKDAYGRIATTEAAQTARYRDQERARRMLAMAKSSS